MDSAIIYCVFLIMTATAGNTADYFNKQLDKISEITGKQMPCRASYAEELKLIAQCQQDVIATLIGK